MTRTRAMNLVKKHGSIINAAKKSHCSGKEIAAALGKAVEGRPLEPIAEANHPKAPTQKLRSSHVSVDDILGEYDDDAKALAAVKAGVRHIRKGSFIRDYELRRMVNYGDAKLWRAAATSDPEICAMQMEATKGGSTTVYWSDPDTVRETIKRSPARLNAVQAGGQQHDAR